MALDLHLNRSLLSSETGREGRRKTRKHTGEKSWQWCEKSPHMWAKLGRGRARAKPVLCSCPDVLCHAFVCGVPGDSKEAKSQSQTGSELEVAGGFSHLSACLCWECCRESHFSMNLTFNFTHTLSSLESSTGGYLVSRPLSKRAQASQGKCSEHTASALPLEPDLLTSERCINRLLVSNSCIWMRNHPEVADGGGGLRGESGAWSGGVSEVLLSTCPGPRCAAGL
jgi:hypothetical protein